MLYSHYTPVLLYQQVYHFLSDEFWRLNRERSDDEVYQLMHLLGFETNESSNADNDNYRQGIDKKYRVRGNALNRWQYAFFQQDLPKHVIGYLIKEKYIEAKGANETDGSLYIHRETSQTSDKIPQPEQRTAASTEPEEPMHLEGNRRMGFEPESRMTQATYRTETS